METVLATLLDIHSIIRWVVVVVAAAAALKFVLGWTQRTPWQAADRGLMSAFTGLIDLNVTLGIVMFIIFGVQSGEWPMYRIEHAGTMLLVAVVAHATARWRKKGDDAAQFRNSLIVVLVVMLLIVGGVASLPGGWSR